MKKLVALLSLAMVCSAVSAIAKNDYSHESRIKRCWSASTACTLLTS